MTDVFLRLYAEHPLRQAMALTVIERLKLMKDARISVITPKGGAGWLKNPDWQLHVLPERWRLLLADKADFWRSSRQMAEDRAESETYVVLDDDHLPIGKWWLDTGVTALKRRPDYAALASWSVVRGEVEPEAVAREGIPSDDNVFGTYALGTPYFIRKGTVPVFPEGPVHDYDQRVSEVMMRAGHLGFLRHVNHVHIGVGASVVIPECWLV